MKNDDKVRYEGKEYTLRRWVSANRGSYGRSEARWKAGVRDPIEILYGKPDVPKMDAIPESEIRFLKKTRYARKGQTDEWELACELIGEPYVRIPEIRRLVLE